MENENLNQAEKPTLNKGDVSGPLPSYEEICKKYGIFKSGGWSSHPDDCF